MIRHSSFRPAWWLPGAHLQTLYPSLIRRRAHPALERERLELPDGDFIDLDWTRPAGRPIVEIKIFLVIRTAAFWAALGSLN